MHVITSMELIGMTKKNKDTTHILRFIAISLMFAVMMSAGAIGGGNGGGGGGT